METGELFFWTSVLLITSLLAREINWMETIRTIRALTWKFLPLYSLEKLIEWKHLYTVSIGEVIDTLYSLEKLIEWKPIRIIRAFFIDLQPLYSLEKLIEWKPPMYWLGILAKQIFLSTRT